MLVSSCPLPVPAGSVRGASPVGEVSHPEKRRFVRILTFPFGGPGFPVAERRNEMDPKIGESHQARKELFRKGVRRGFLTVEEIEKSLPPGVLAAAERWLLYYSLRAAEIEIVADEGDMQAIDEAAEEFLDEEPAKGEAREPAEPG